MIFICITEPAVFHHGQKAVLFKTAIGSLVVHHVLLALLACYGFGMDIN